MQMLEQLKRDHPTRAGGDHERPRQHRDGGAGDQARRLRLHREAVQGRPDDPDRPARHRGGAAAARERGAAAARRRRPGADRPVAADQSAAPGDRPGGADQQPGADHRAGRLRQGGGRPAHPRPLAPRQRAVRRSQLRVDGAGADGGRAVRRRRAGRHGSRRRARSAPSRRRTTARCCSTRSPTCRRRRRARSSASCRSRSSSGSAARPGSRSTSASSPRPPAISAEEIQAGRFREDLFYRLSVVPLRVPALKERREDIPLLARHFMTRAAESSGQRPREISEDAMAALQTYDWPGNVRELRNIIERLLIMAPGGVDDPIRADMLPAEFDAKFAASRRSDRSQRDHGPAAEERARDLRARVSAGAGQPLRRQHLAHRRLRRHGALGAAPQAEVARHPGRRQVAARRANDACARLLPATSARLAAR